MDKCIKYDAVIIGAGPGGISSALYIKRGNFNVAVISKKESNLIGAEWVDNYYGFPGGISGEELFNNGLKQALKMGVDVFNDEVVEIDYDGNFRVKTLRNVFSSKTLVLATGSKKNKVAITGSDKFIGFGVSYCAICDGFFYKDKKIGLLGNSQYALHELEILKNVSSDITLFTNGLDVTFNELSVSSINIIKDKIVSANGDEKLKSVTLENGNIIDIDCLFIALGSAKTSELALKLGVMLDNDKIKVNDKMETNVPGLYACGDATKGLQQISKAVYEGSVAGVEIIKRLKK